MIVIVRRRKRGVNWLMLGLLFVSGVVFAGWEMIADPGAAARIGMSDDQYAALEESVKDVKRELLASAWACCENSDDTLAKAEFGGNCYASYDGPKMRRFFNLEEKDRAYLLVGVQCSDLSSGFTYCYRDAQLNCMPLVEMEW